LPAVIAPHGSSTVARRLIGLNTHMGHMPKVSVTPYMLSAAFGRVASSSRGLIALAFERAGSRAAARMM